MKQMLSSLVFSFFALTVLGQTMRSSNPKEKIVIDKAVQAIMPVLQPFADNNWTLEDGGADNPNDYLVAIYPDEPIGTAPFSDLRFTMKQGTDLWSAEIKPLLNKIQDPKNTPTNDATAAAYDNLTNAYELNSEVIIEVHVNESNIDVKPIVGGKNDLKIPGCYFSYKPTINLVTHQDLTNEFVLAFGNWKTAKMNKSSDMPIYYFAFAHPKGTPYIENIVIILKGNVNRIKAMLHKIDWTPINNGLTL